MSAITRERVEALAALAQIDLSDEEIDLFVRQLGDFLEYATTVQNVDTSGVPPTATVLSGGGRDRADEVRTSMPRDEALANAPDPARNAGFFRVPRVIG
jgi:aspartyl-tRNA(Asn)/glutamyl-tRNA(Gln) amidotransferase subunit C